MKIITGRIVTEHEVFDGTIYIENDRITQIEKGKPEKKPDHNFSGNLILPGFIDVHTHGIDKFGMLKAEDIAGGALAQVKFGVTGFLPTIASCTYEEFLEHSKNIILAREKTSGKGANIFGSHFEGPFINVERKGGMHEDFLMPMDLKACKEFIEKSEGILKLITLSPELDGADEVIKLLVKNNVTASVGHSRASAEDLKHAVSLGLNHACHLYNAFDKIDEKEGGVWATSLIGEILNQDNINFEVICDLHHVNAQLIKLAFKTGGPDRFITITDSMEGTGLPAGKFNMLDGRKYDTSSGASRLAAGENKAGGLVGSVLTMNKGFENIVETCGLDLVSAAKATSLNPAKSIKLDQNYGSIKCGKIADIAVLDENYNCLTTFVSGQKVFD